MVTIVNFFTWLAVIGGIAALGIFGVINLWQEHIGKGLVLLVLCFFAIRLVIWLETPSEYG